MIGVAMDYWEHGLVRLRAIEMADVDLVASIDRDVEGARHMSRIGPLRSRAATEEWLERQVRRTFAAEDGIWTIDHRDGAAVGLVTTHGCNLRTGTFSHAIQVIPGCRRRGVARTALALVLRYYFDELRYQKSTASVHSDNEGSIRLHASLGFRQEGRLRRMLYTEGRLLDELWFGLTDDEFKGTGSQIL